MFENLPFEILQIIIADNFGSTNAISRLNKSTAARLKQYLFWRFKNLHAFATAYVKSNFHKSLNTYAPFVNPIYIIQNLYKVQNRKGLLTHLQQNNLIEMILSRGSYSSQLNAIVLALKFKMFERHQLPDTILTKLPKHLVEKIKNAGFLHGHLSL